MSAVEKRGSLSTLEERALLKKRRPWYYLALLLFILSIVFKMPLMLLAAILTLLVALIPELWLRLALKHLLVRQRVNHQHLFFGEEVVLSVVVENRKMLPLPWLQIENPITPPLTVVGQRKTLSQRDTLISTWLLWPYQRVTRRYRMTCQDRGFHVFGPTRLNCSDPFGWIESERYLAANETLLVYPLIAPLEALNLPPVRTIGERVGQRQLLEDPLWFAGIRDYQLGDDPRRIDWKATARTGELRSKIFESTTMRRLLVVLDTWAYTGLQKGVDLEVQEFCISVAASLAVWGLEEGYAVGMLANSGMVTTTHELSSEATTDILQNQEQILKSNGLTISPAGITIPFSLDHGQYEHILTTLARLIPSHITPIERMIELEDEMFPSGTTVVVVSPVETLNEATLARLWERRIRGNTIAIVTVGDLPEDYQEPETQTIRLYHVGGKEKWHELVNTVGAGKGENIGTSSTRLQLD
ncbi:DUF58 domain-containing protein [Tengunoibacter tsumagoiensis]|uniref:DUF58 domain-containing protein n=1 Tax=Tengunoibacter tsumagoiensis TaxID=2014871 RepID=A0A401ZWI7_9CHLR|nr:DUF58 domain-containing protein [Tengunoibacter tsumagoiensis]GCE11140.1 hypothetical protein KTT_09990 [Tengunoibacter tsumagoiensis]